MTMDEMATTYDKFAGAHKYLVGFARCSAVYYVLASFEEMRAFMKLDRASSKKGGHAKIRVRVSSTQAAQLVYSGKAVKLCDESELNTDAGHNKGENFERIVTEKLTGELWVKDNIPFYVKGDITLNGEEVQVKLSGAELTNEKTLARTAEILANA